MSASCRTSTRARPRRIDCDRPPARSRATSDAGTSAACGDRAGTDPPADRRSALCLAALQCTGNPTARQLLLRSSVRGCTVSTADRLLASARDHAHERLRKQLERGPRSRADADRPGCPELRARAFAMDGGSLFPPGIAAAGGLQDVATGIHDCDQIAYGRWGVRPCGGDVDGCWLLPRLRTACGSSTRPVTKLSRS